LIPIKSEDDFKKFETTLFLKALFQLESKIDYLKNQNEKILNDIDTIKQEIYQMPANNYYSVEEENSDNWAESLNSLNLENIEKELIMFSLKKYNGNRKMAAQSLGISLRTFYRKLKYYNLNIEN
jgi:DNA-binding NtrC family response regulator